jgi:hypothetical protein
MSDWQHAGAGARSDPSCPWCGGIVTPDAGACPNCGDSVAQREDLGGMAIAGVTTIDPGVYRDVEAEVARYRKEATRSAFHSNLHLLTLALDAADWMADHEPATRKQESPRPDELGVPSEAALLLSSRLDQEEHPSVQAPVDTWSIVAAPDGPASDPNAWWNQPDRGGPADDGLAACPWCLARCAPDATSCETCGARLAVANRIEEPQ